jgi:hypothetical protein
MKAKEEREKIKMVLNNADMAWLRREETQHYGVSIEKNIYI